MIAMPSDVSTFYLLGLPKVSGLDDLSAHLHLSPSLMYRLVTAPRCYYKVFDVPKRGRGTRTIYCPAKPLKAVQGWVLHSVLERVMPLALEASATAFRRGVGALDNVRPHLGHEYFLCLDIEDFFPSITYGKVYSVFRALGYEAHACHILTSLVTCNGRLPQGGVTSPALSNIICRRLDRRVEGYCARRDVAYTRYADDLAFSANTPYVLVGVKHRVREITRDEGFNLNSAKTRFMGPRSQRRVTGLVISGQNAGVGRKRKRGLRAMIHRLERRVEDDAERAKLEATLQGWMAYLNAVDPTGRHQLERFWTGLRKA